MPPARLFVRVADPELVVRSELPAAFSALALLTAGNVLCKSLLLCIDTLHDAFPLERKETLTSGLRSEG